MSTNGRHYARDNVVRFLRPILYVADIPLVPETENLIDNSRPHVSVFQVDGVVHITLCVKKHTVWAGAHKNNATLTDRIAVIDLFLGNATWIALLVVIDEFGFTYDKESQKCIPKTGVA